MKPAASIFALVVLGYALSTGSLPPALRGSLAALAMASLVAWRYAGPLKLSMVIHALMAVTLGAGALAYTFAVANHHFVLAYAALGFVVCSVESEEQSQAELQLTMARLLGAVIGVSVLQKLASPVYVNGSFFAHLFDTGSLGGPLLSPCRACLEVVEANTESIISFVGEVPAAGTVLELPSTVALDPGFALRFGRAMGLSVVVFEIWLTCVFVLAPRHRAGPASLLVFVCGLALFREEWVFGSVLCALAFAACSPTWQRLRLLLGLACGAFALLAVAF
jgi:hypothetical protein